MAAPRIAVMPQHHPRLAHFMPYWRGDSLLALLLAIVRRYWGIDQNGQADAEGVIWILHWGNALKNKLRWIVAVNEHGHWLYDAHGREIRVRDPRGRVPISRRSTPEVQRLRSRRRGGRKLYTAVQHVERLGRLQHARHRRLVLALEAKGAPRFGEKRTFLRLHQVAEAQGVSVVVMTLQSIPGWRKRLRAAHLAGFQTALLPRGPKPSDWSDIEPYVDAVWGKWRKR